MTRDIKLALAAAGIIAAIEFPVSKFYSTTPATTTAKRMGIAAGMAFVSVFLASKLLRDDTRSLP